MPAMTSLLILASGDGDVDLTRLPAAATAAVAGVNQPAEHQRLQRPRGLLRSNGARCGDDGDESVCHRVRRPSCASTHPYQAESEDSSVTATLQGA
jgi:hypothetical protein